MQLAELGERMVASQGLQFEQTPDSAQLQSPLLLRLQPHLCPKHPPRLLYSILSSPGRKQGREREEADESFKCLLHLKRQSFGSGQGALQRPLGTRWRKISKGFQKDWHLN